MAHCNESMSLGDRNASKYVLATARPHVATMRPPLLCRRSASPERPPHSTAEEDGVEQEEQGQRDGETLGDNDLEPACTTSSLHTRGCEPPITPVHQRARGVAHSEPLMASSPRLSDSGGFQGPPSVDSQNCALPESSPRPSSGGVTGCSASAPGQAKSAGVCGPRAVGKSWVEMLSELDRDMEGLEDPTSDSLAAILSEFDQGDSEPPSPQALPAASPAHSRRTGSPRLQNCCSCSRHGPETCGVHAADSTGDGPSSGRSSPWLTGGCRGIIPEALAEILSELDDDDACEAVSPDGLGVPLVYSPGLSPSRGEDYHTRPGDQADELVAAGHGQCRTGAEGQVQQRGRPGLQRSPPSRHNGSAFGEGALGASAQAQDGAWRREGKNSSSSSSMSRPSTAGCSPAGQRYATGQDGSPSRGASTPGLAASRRSPLSRQDPVDGENRVIGTAAALVGGPPAVHSRASFWAEEEDDEEERAPVYARAFTTQGQQTRRCLAEVPHRPNTAAGSGAQRPGPGMRMMPRSSTTSNTGVEGEHGQGWTGQGSPPVHQKSAGSSPEVAFHLRPLPGTRGPPLVYRVSPSSSPDVGSPIARRGPLSATFPPGEGSGGRGSPVGFRRSSAGTPGAYPHRAGNFPRSFSSAESSGQLSRPRSQLRLLQLRVHDVPLKGGEGYNSGSPRGSGGLSAPATSAGLPRSRSSAGPSDLSPKELVQRGAGEGGRMAYSLQLARAAAAARCRDTSSPEPRASRPPSKPNSSSGLRGAERKPGLNCMTPPPNLGRGPALDVSSEGDGRSNSCPHATERVVTVSPEWSCAQGEFAEGAPPLHLDVASRGPGLRGGGSPPVHHSHALRAQRMRARQSTAPSERLPLHVPWEHLREGRSASDPNALSNMQTMMGPTSQGTAGEGGVGRVWSGNRVAGLGTGPRLFPTEGSSWE